jgi:hypothetical protein
MCLSSRLWRAARCTISAAAKPLAELVSYNPNSSLFALEKIKKLPFANQVKVFNTGFGMWQDNVRSIEVGMI